MKFDFDAYKKACLQFAEEKWSYLPNDVFYTSFGTEWRETSDNAHSGIDVSWAFKKSQDYVEALAERHFREELRNTMEQILDQFDDLDLDQIAGFISVFC